MNEQITCKKAKRAKKLGILSILFLQASIVCFLICTLTELGNSAIFMGIVLFLFGAFILALISVAIHKTLAGSISLILSSGLVICYIWLIYVVEKDINESQYKPFPTGYNITPLQHHFYLYEQMRSVQGLSANQDGTIQLLR
jgi:hypothetical protein